MSCIVFSFKFAFIMLFSAVGITNLFLTKNRVADLQGSLFNDSPSLSLPPEAPRYFLLGY